MGHELNLCAKILVKYLKPNDEHFWTVFKSIPQVLKSLERRKTGCLSVMNLALSNFQLYKMVNNVLFKF